MSSTIRTEAGAAESGAPQSHELVSILRDRILHGDLAPGQRLVERTLASELGVSRIPVRDALNILRGEGFVSALPNRGMTVTALSPQDVEELFEVRESLEVLAVRRATERATPDEIDRLEQSIAASEAAWERSDTDAVGRCNQEFHDLLWKMAHNSLLSSLMEPLEGRMHWLLRQNDDPRRLQAEHVAILAAIRSGDAELAARSALDHVQTSREIWLDLSARRRTA
ncbi:HTH-type transcriptional repressor RspR [Leucobacter aridicollis]|uniref:DNA-binding GntR family transcriptional regulator n=1 Tax=Leucobacter aridicollis TaxID=283878 RepID=A0A852R7X6_9MICO|nr:GntR family transcriptional regulator [Leucobacter aridicollis]MBL3681445.1 GntR family transcriptional regulator [Leucobacter aridicollis]NYD27525.1 DNA-binding GntR family transcriptional regulator [Leucobacter aridicollis]